MPASKKKVNLLPKDPFELSFVGKLLKWALSVGRYIVIGTELVVVGSFLARFSLDRQLTDLNEAIAMKQAVIASYGDLEKEVRSIQARLNFVDEVAKRQLGVETFLNTIKSFTPVDVVYSTITISKEEIVLRGSAYSEAGFRTLLSELRSNDDFAKVRMERVESEGDAGPSIDFDIAVELAQKTNTAANTRALTVEEGGKE